MSNLNDIYEFIKLQDSEATAKTVVNNSVAVMSKIAVLFYNDLMTQREEEMLLEVIDVEKKLMESFLEEVELKSGNYSAILGHVRVLGSKTDFLVGVRFSEKTKNRAKEVFRYFSNENVFRYLFTNDEAQHRFLNKFSDISKQALLNLETTKNFLVDRQQSQGQMSNLTKMSSEIQAKQVTKVESKKNIKINPQSEHMISENALRALGSLQRFIEYESKDGRKAEDLIRNILTIIVKLEVGFEASYFSEEDQQKLFEFVEIVRDVLSTFLSVRDDETGSIYEEELSKLFQLYDETEEKLCDLLRPHFGGNTLSRVKSVFYYFKKPEVNLFYFKVMEDERMREDIGRMMRHALNDVTTSVLCVPPEFS